MEREFAKVKILQNGQFGCESSLVTAAQGARKVQAKGLRFSNVNPAGLPGSAAQQSFPGTDLHFTGRVFGQRDRVLARPAPPREHAESRRQKQMPCYVPRAKAGNRPNKPEPRPRGEVRVHGDLPHDAGPRGREHSGLSGTLLEPGRHWKRRSPV